MKPSILENKEKRNNKNSLFILSDQLNMPHINEKYWFGCVNR
jgi:hypothetical protein